MQRECWVVVGECTLTRQIRDAGSSMSVCDCGAKNERWFPLCRRLCVSHHIPCSGVFVDILPMSRKGCAHESRSWKMRVCNVVENSLESDACPNPQWDSFGSTSHSIGQLERIGQESLSLGISQSFWFFGWKVLSSCPFPSVSRWVHYFPSKRFSLVTPNWGIEQLAILYNIVILVYWLKCLLVVVSAHYHIMNTDVPFMLLIIADLHHTCLFLKTHGTRYYGGISYIQKRCSTFQPACKWNFSYFCSTINNKVERKRGSIVSQSWAGMNQDKSLWAETSFVSVSCFFLLLLLLRLTQLGHNSSFLTCSWRFSSSSSSFVFPSLLLCVLVHCRFLFQAPCSLVQQSHSWFM